MTQRDARLIEALIGGNRLSLDTFGPGIVWVPAAKATRTPDPAARARQSANPRTKAMTSPAPDQNRRSSSRY